MGKKKTDEQTENIEKIVADEQPVEFEYRETEQQASVDPKDEELAQLNNRYLRLQADFDNYKKRNAATSIKMYNEGVDEVLTSILATLDYLDMAIQAQKDESQRKGIELVKKTLLDAMAKFDVTTIGAVGEDFDPNVHEAVMNREDPDNVGKVVQVLKIGYKRNQTVLRHPMVAVGQ